MSTDKRSKMASNAIKDRLKTLTRVYRDRLGRFDLSPTVALFRQERFAQFGILTIGFFALLAVIGPWIVPYDPDETNRNEDGEVIRSEPPSADHWFGTTNFGEDVFSQVIVSARVSVIVGFVAAFVAILIGTNIGLISGYFGGWIDDLLMRITDIAFALPFLPFVLVLVFMFGASLQNIILVIAVLMWRSSARVIRSEVLTQKNRPYVESARALGAGDFRIMYRHILPNVLPLVVLYFAFAVALAIIFEASISFLGFGDPRMNSWGRMVHQAYDAGGLRRAWWWSIPPGFAVMLLAMAVFFIGRAIEKISNPSLRH